MYLNQSDQIRNSTKTGTTESECFLSELICLVIKRLCFLPQMLMIANLHKRCRCQILIDPHIISTLKWVINTVYNKREDKLLVAFRIILRQHCINIYSELALAGGFYLA